MKVDRTSLLLARFAVRAVQGPQLGDVAAPIEARVRAFSARLRAFRESFEKRAEPLQVDEVPH